MKIGTHVHGGFASVFLGVGVLAALVGAYVITGVTVNGSIPDGPTRGLAAAGTFFAPIGLALVLAMIIGTRAREWIEDAPDHLLVGHGWLGLTWGEKRLPKKREIEGVDLSTSPTSSGAR